jgi:hypothetical protein
VLNTPDIKHGWAWSPPVTLLGKACFVEGEEEDFFRSLLVTPLSHRNVVRHAPRFAEIAEGLVDDLISGKFEDGNHKDETGGDDSSSDGGDSGCSPNQHGDGGDQSRGCKSHKIKWDFLRTYTLDLIDGPVLGMNKWTKEPEQSHGESTAQESEEVEGDTRKPMTEEAKKLMRHRKMMLLWICRMKSALCVIKVTLGTEWMYMWLMNTYGRAVISRKHLVKHIRRHVEERAKQVPVRHAPGYAINDALATPIPIVSITSIARLMAFLSNRYVLTCMCSTVDNSRERVLREGERYWRSWDPSVETSVTV